MFSAGKPSSIAFRLSFPTTNQGSDSQCLHTYNPLVRRETSLTATSKLKEDGIFVLPLQLQKMRVGWIAHHSHSKGWILDQDGHMSGVLVSYRRKSNTRMQGYL